MTSGVATGRLSDILGDGTLVKDVLRGGAGRQPEAGDRVSVHYRCGVALPAAGESEALDSSEDRRQPMTFVLGDSEVILGLERAVETMCEGERAAFVVHPSLAHGAAGCCAGLVPQGVGAADGAALVEAPPAGALRLEVELLEVRRQGGPLAEAEDLSPEACLQASMRAKDAGNADFKAGDLQKASASYERALRLIGVEIEEPVDRGGGDPPDDARWEDAARKEARDQLALSCLLNLSQCELRLERFSEARRHASLAADLDPASSKAVYRRGLAAMGLGLLEPARADLAEAARREPRSAEVRAQLQECKRRLQASEQRERSTFGGMFERGSMYGDAAKAEPLAAPAADGTSGG